MEGFEDVEALLHHREDGTVEVHSWITKVPTTLSFSRLGTSLQGRKTAELGAAKVDKEDTSQSLESNAGRQRGSKQVEYRADEHRFLETCGGSSAPRSCNHFHVRQVQVNASEVSYV